MPPEIERHIKNFIDLSFITDEIVENEIKHYNITNSYYKRIIKDDNDEYYCIIEGDISRLEFTICSKRKAFWKISDTISYYINHFTEQDLTKYNMKSKEEGISHVVNNLMNNQEFDIKFSY